MEEECGLRVAPLRLPAVLDREKQGHVPPLLFSVYKMFFHCRVDGGSPARTLESSESGFFALDALPELSEGRVLPRQILSLYEAVRSGSAEAALLTTPPFHPAASCDVMRAVRTEAAIRPGCKIRGDFFGPTW